MTTKTNISALQQGRWNFVAPLEEARSHPATCSLEGLIFACGGGGPDFASLDSVVAYDPTLDRWEERHPLPFPRSGAAAFAVDGEIWVCGGGFKQANGTFRFLERVDIYDPQEDRWREGPPLLQPHDYPAAAQVDDRLYILGGHHPEACLGGPKTDPGFAFSEVLAPSEVDARWRRLEDMPTPRFAASAFCRDGTVEVSGGVAFQDGAFDNFDLVERLDPKTGTWSPSSLRLPWPAAGHGTAIFHGTLLTFGGYSTDDIHPRTAAWDEDNQRWVRLADMPLPRAAMGVAVVNDRLYLVGGWADDGRTPMNQTVVFTVD